MIVEYTRYKIGEGRRSVFERAYAEAGESPEASSHCLAHEFKTSFASARPYLKGIQEMSHYQVISLSGKRQTSLDQ
jgi:hypothetical protein